jgi:hypothetical protein
VKWSGHLNQLGVQMWNEKNERLRVTAALAAIDGVRSDKDFRTARRLVARCHPVCQLALTDSLLGSRKRIS